MLRYEPLPHKNTLGFWVRPEDWADWNFTVKTAGSFQVEGLIGCGKGSGGAEVEFIFGEHLEGAAGLEHGSDGLHDAVTADALGRELVRLRAEAREADAVATRLVGLALAASAARALCAEKPSVRG